MSSLVLPCLGLAPDQHPLQAPPGTMRVADNVVCDLPGIVRGRPNFTQSTSKSTTFTPVAMHVFGSTPIVVSKDGSSYRLESASGVITTGTDAAPVSFDAKETSFAEARKSLYYCSSTGVRALRTEASSSTEAAGLYPVLAPSYACLATTATPVGPFTDPFAAAYVMVVKRTDANGVERRSPPSERFYIRSDSAGTTRSIIIANGAGASTRISFQSGSVIAGDVIEFYRTVTVNTAYGTPAADAYLVTSYTVTSTDVTNGYFPPSGTIIYDGVSDTQLGEALYTNPQRDGILNAKTRPPIAMDVALWASCMWYGRTTTPHRLTIRILYAGQDSATAEFRRNPTAQSIGHHAYSAAGVANTGDLASGTNTILNVVNVTGVNIGDYVCQGNDTPFLTAAANNIPSGTTITNISGAGPYTVTMSQNATGTTVGAALRMFNKVTIDGVPYAVGHTQFLGVNGDSQTFELLTASTMELRAELLAQNFVRAINVTTARGLASIRAYNGVDGAIILERTTLQGASFTVTSTKPQAFAPELGSGLTSTQESIVNRVYFSLPDEPEAVPLLNYFDVGSQLYPIQKLVPMKDALLIFKEDGIYRVTGSFPNWSVDCIDEKARLVRPECAAVLDGVTYAWTNRGVLAVDETGVRESISNGKIDYSTLFTPQAAILGDSGFHGARVLVSERHNLVLLTIPNVASSPIYYSDHVYCFAVKTGKWTKWPGLYVRCGAAQSTGRLWICGNNELNEMEWSLQYLTDTPRGYDLTYSGLAWTDTASSVSMSISSAQRGEWVPKAGDWVWWTIGSVYWRRILAASADGGGGYDITLDSAAPSNIASATVRGAVVGTPVVMEWMPSAMNTGGISLGVWRELTFQMMGEAQAKVSPTDFRVTVGVRHDGSATVASVTGTPDRSVVVMRPYRVGWPRQAGRRPIAFPRLSWSEIDWPWMLGGIALIGEDGSERVRQ